MNKEIDRLVSKMVKNLDYSMKIRKDLKLQFLDHINNLKDEYIQKGLSEREAINNAIKDFGKGEEIIESLNIPNSKINKSIKLVMSALFILSLMLVTVFFISPITNEAQTISIMRNSPDKAMYLVTIKLIPFKTLVKLFSHDTTPYTPGFLNIFFFIPIGLFIPFILNKYFNKEYIIKSIGLFVLGIQIIRIFLPVGFVSIDIAILNFLGCLLGFLIYNFCVAKVLKLRDNGECHGF